MNQSLAIESVFVGVYCTVVFLLIHPFIRNPYFLLFVFGFFKHLLGAYLGLQNYYCNHGQACHSLESSNSIYRKDNILWESVLEGAWFLVLGSMAFRVSSRLDIRLAMIFGIGLFTHIFAEYIGLHRYICENRCV
jgi:hypothetical protein